MVEVLSRFFSDVKTRLADSNSGGEILQEKFRETSLLEALYIIYRLYSLILFKTKPSQGKSFGRFFFIFN